MTIPKNYTCTRLNFFRDHSNVTINVRAIDFLGNESHESFQFSVESALMSNTESDKSLSSK